MKDWRVTSFMCNDHKSCGLTLCSRFEFDDQSEELEEIVQQFA